MYVIGETSVAIQIKKNLFNQKYVFTKNNVSYREKEQISPLWFISSDVHREPGASNPLDRDKVGPLKSQIHSPGEF